VSVREAAIAAAAVTANGALGVIIVIAAVGGRAPVEGLLVGTSTHLSGSLSVALAIRPESAKGILLAGCVRVVSFGRQAVDQAVSSG